MNVERLHKVLIDLNEDIKVNKTISFLTQVRDHLQNQVNQPNQPAHQNNLVKSIDTLYKSLTHSNYNNYSPSWKEIISEISGDTLFGNPLKNKIQNIFASNSITPAKALEDIKKIVTDFQSFQTAINNLLNGLKVLKIGKEELEPGQCELGYTIPRNFVEEKLSGFKKEIGELNFILNNISEAVTGEKKDYCVKTISSSDFLLYIIIGLQVADVLSKATERILNHYKQILEIKALRNQLKEKGVPATQTKGIETYANNMMKSEIKKIAKEVINEHYNGNGERKNELENGLVISFNKIANRIDKGFNVEIRVAPLPAPKEKQEITEEQEQNFKLINSIISSSKNIDFIETDGESILKLPEKVK